MITIHAKIIGDEAVVPRSELDRLIEIARRSEDIDLQTDDLPAGGIMYLAQTGGAFDQVAGVKDSYAAVTSDLRRPTNDISGVAKSSKEWYNLNSSYFGCNEVIS